MVKTIEERYVDAINFGYSPENIRHNVEQNIARITDTMRDSATRYQPLCSLDDLMNELKSANSDWLFISDKLFENAA